MFTSILVAGCCELIPRFPFVVKIVVNSLKLFLTGPVVINPPVDECILCTCIPISPSLSFSTRVPPDSHTLTKEYLSQVLQVLQVKCTSYTKDISEVIIP